MTEDIQTFRVEVVLTNRQAERQTERTDRQNVRLNGRTNGTVYSGLGRRAYIRICEKHPKYRS